MKSITSSTDENVLNTTKKLLSNIYDDGTRKIILNSILAMTHILNEMMDDIPKIKDIHTAEGSELIALIVAEALERGISIDDDLFNKL